MFFLGGEDMRTKILIVDDSLTDLAIIESMLR